MSEQPEALRLAESLLRDWETDNHDYDDMLNAAAELRRLHEVNALLMDALWYSVDNPEFDSAVFDRMTRDALSRAIAQ